MMGCCNDYFRFAQSEEWVAESCDQSGISRSTSVEDGRHTGRVGTLLYVSPEIKMSYGKTAYTQKVDIYR